MADNDVPNVAKPAIYDPQNDPEGAKKADEFLAKKAAENKPAEIVTAWQDPAPEEVPLISIDDFSKVRLKTAQIISAALHPKADRLLVLQLQVGDKSKQIVAGIRQDYPLESLAGRTIIIVDNLKPTSLRGQESNGMLLAVRTPTGLRLLTVDGPTAKEQPAPAIAVQGVASGLAVG